MVVPGEATEEAREAMAVEVAKEPIEVVDAAAREATAAEVAEVVREARCHGRQILLLLPQRQL